MSFLNVCGSTQAKDEKTAVLVSRRRHLLGTGHSSVARGKVGQTVLLRQELLQLHVVLFLGVPVVVEGCLPDERRHLDDESTQTQGTSHSVI